MNEAFDKLLERTCKDLIQKWSHEGGKKSFAIGVILEMIKDQGELDDEQTLITSLQNVDDWQIIKKLMGLAAFMPPNIFIVYVSIIEKGLKNHDATKRVIIADTQLLLSLQLGPDVANEMTPAIQSIDDLQKLKAIFIAAARAPNLATFRGAHPKFQKTVDPKPAPPQQQQEERKRAKLPKKLIEVNIPLQAINFEASSEKTISQGHPSSLHRYWARRPPRRLPRCYFRQHGR